MKKGGEVEGRVGRVEETLYDQAVAHTRLDAQLEALSARSDERMDTLYERFDKLDMRIDRLIAASEEESKRRKEGRNRLLSGAFTIVLTFCTSLYYTYLDPMDQELKAMVNKVQDLELEMERRNVRHTDTSGLLVDSNVIDGVQPTS